jgi:hypothetical protein
MAKYTSELINTLDNSRLTETMLGLLVLLSWETCWSSSILPLSALLLLLSLFPGAYLYRFCQYFARCGVWRHCRGNNVRQYS